MDVWNPSVHRFNHVFVEHGPLYSRGENHGGVSRYESSISCRMNECLEQPIYGLTRWKGR